MPRKQHEQSDSLEMLLDTMCNAFGADLNRNNDCAPGKTSNAKRWRPRCRNSEN